MADIAATLATAQGWAKEIFGDVQRLALPKHAKVSKRIKFKQKKKIGKEYTFPVWTGSEGGFTHGPGSTLQEARAAVSQDAGLTGSEITLRSLIDIKTLTSHMSDKDSFGEYFGEHLMQCKRSFARRLETTMLYGGSPIATVASGTGGPGGTARVYTLSDASFAPHIFLGTKTHQMDAFNAAVKLNTNGPIEITSYNPRTRELAVSGVAADLTAIDGAGVAADFYWRTMLTGAGASQTAAGLYKIGNETGNVTYCGINHQSNPDTWQGSQVDAGGNAFDWDKLNELLEMMVGKGCESPLIATTSLRTWGNLITDITALRAFDSSYKVKEGEFGVESIKFHSFAGMPVTIEPSGFVKRSNVIVYPDVEHEDYSDLADRIGSTDVTIMHPMAGGEMIVMVPGTNFFETKFYSDQAVRVNPRDVGICNNIVPTT